MSNYPDWDDIKQQFAGLGTISKFLMGITGAFVILTMFVMCSPRPDSALAPGETYTQPEIDADEEMAAFGKVTNIVGSYATAYLSASNEIQKTDLRYQRGEALCTVRPGYFITMATIDEIRTEKDGDAHISFTTPGGIGLETDNTIARGSSLHQRLGQYREGQQVAIRFKFLNDRTGKDCFRSNRWLEQTNMTRPRFDIDLNGVG